MALSKLGLVWILLCFIGITAAGANQRLPVPEPVPRKCKFPALYNFGDSNSDTGGLSAAMWLVHPPNGETFFGAPSGRQCNGRLVIDFIAERLNLPLLNAYLDSIGTNFQHGANFASGGASILPGGYSPFHLELQIGQFLQFKSRATALSQRLNLKGMHANNLPRELDFSEALYVFDIGQNDISHGFQYTSEAQTKASIPTILDKFAEAIYKLYNAGARNFWIHNTGPIGCLPFSVINNQGKPGSLDSNGCIDSQNEVAREFNRQLEHRVFLFKKNLQGAAFTYVDMYTAKYSVIIHAKTIGFEDPFTFCCGGNYGYQISCGKMIVVNGTSQYNPSCPDPVRYVSWDGIHYSEAANLIVSKLILEGFQSSISKACLISP